MPKFNKKLLEKEIASKVPNLRLSTGKCCGTCNFYFMAIPYMRCSFDSHNAEIREYHVCDKWVPKSFITDRLKL